MRMEFGIRKCSVLVLKKGKVVDSDGVQLPNGERMQFVEEEGYKYLGILEVDDLQHAVMKERFCAEYFRRLKKVLSFFQTEQLKGHQSSQSLGRSCYAVWCWDRELDTDKITGNRLENTE